MEYPVLTGLYQYVSMALAKTYTALTKTAPLPVVAEVVMFFDIAALGLALAWLATVWATAGLAGRRIWDAALVAGLPIVIFQIVHQLRRAGNGFRHRRHARLGAAQTGAGRGVDRAGGGRQAVSALLLVPLLLLGVRTGRLARGRQDCAAAVRRVVRGEPADDAAVPAGLVGVLPAQHPPRRRYGFALQRGASRSPVGRGFDHNLGFWQPPVMLNSVVAVLFVLCCAAIGYIALTAPQRPRVAQLAFLVVAAFLLTNKVWSPQFSLWLVPLAVLALPHRRILLAWMTVDALVWVPRMLYLYGEQTRACPSNGSPRPCCCATSRWWCCACW